MLPKIYKKKKPTEMSPKKYLEYLKSKGLTDEEIEILLAYKSMFDDNVSLKNGDKIKLNVAMIKSHPDYERKTVKFKQFIDDNADTVFEAKFERGYIVLDDTWLFDYITDVIKVD